MILMRRVWTALCLAILVTALPACRSDPTPARAANIPRGEPPAYADVAAAYNARVQRLEKLQAGITMVIRARNAQGDNINEQVEGNLSVAQPGNVALRLDKVSKTIFRLGSNDTKYWWVDLTKDPKVATVGAHASATPETVQALGIPMHPLDLLEVFGITPLPQPGTPAADQAQVAWSPHGQHLGVSLPGRWGQRRFWLDPKTYAPQVIELLDAQGQPAAHATISGFQSITVAGDALVRPLIPKRIDLRLPQNDALVIIETHQASNPGPRLRSQVFDLAAVLRSDGVDTVVDIDRQPPGAPVR
jgi:outer membrane lipoprotein-sorting protein